MLCAGVLTTRVKSLAGEGWPLWCGVPARLLHSVGMVV